MLRALISNVVAAEVEADQDAHKPSWILIPNYNGAGGLWGRFSAAIRCASRATVWYGKKSDLKKSYQKKTLKKYIENLP